MAAAMAAASGSQAPKVMVCLDFGTTFSGFSFAHCSDPEDVQVFYDWPDASRPYCKTQTSLFYSPRGELLAWGWSAVRAYSDALQASLATGSKEVVGFLASRFKPMVEAGDGEFQKEGLPACLSLEKLVVDFLGCISGFVTRHLREKYGSMLRKEEVGWCLTVPASWSDASKRKMETYAEKAGIVKGRHCSGSTASAFPLKIVLEPEAASFYCQKLLRDTVNLGEGDKFIVADVGGGTIDLVVHEKAENGSYKVREVSACSGELGGGTFVDRNFYSFLKTKIGCLESFGDARTVHNVMRWWQGTLGKNSFDGTRSKVFEVPRKLSRAWKRFEEELGIAKDEEEYYEEIELSKEDLSAMFDTEVDKVAALIDEKLTAGGIKHIFLVGGFAENPYLVKKMKDKFEAHDQTRHVIAPPSPGAAICKGGVAIGFDTGAVVSRVSNRWYGFGVSRASEEGDPLEHIVYCRGNYLCDRVFETCVRKGESVLESHSVSRVLRPANSGQAIATVRLWSSTADVAPRYTTDAGCECLLEYAFDIHEGLWLGPTRELLLSVYFGRSSIEVFAQRVNFGTKRQPEKLYRVDIDVEKKRKRLSIE